MTKYGETNNFSVSGLTKEIEKYLNSELDYVIYNNKKVSVKRLKLNRKKHPEFLSLVKFEKERSNNKNFIGENLITSTGEIIHNKNKLAKVILSLI